MSDFCGDVKVLELSKTASTTPLLPRPQFKTLLKLFDFVVEFKQRMKGLFFSFTFVCISMQFCCAREWEFDARHDQVSYIANYYELKISRYRCYLASRNVFNCVFLLKCLFVCKIFSFLHRTTNIIIIYFKELL